MNVFRAAVDNWRVLKFKIASYGSDVHSYFCDEFRLGMYQGASPLFVDILVR